jgi:uncharacterized protein
MKKNMTEILCCPYCKSALKLTIEREENDEIITGRLQCTHCEKTYPIIEGIPNFIDEIS